MKLDVFPILVEALTLRDYSLPFYLYLTRSGYYLSYYLAFYAMSLCLSYTLAFLLCAFENSGCQSPPLLKVNLRTGESLPLRFLERALIRSSGSGLTMRFCNYNKCSRWINIKPSYKNTLMQTYNIIMCFIICLDIYSIYSPNGK